MPCRISARRGLPVGQALGLGLLHGPAELLPISSSGHVGALAWLLGLSYTELDEELRKTFEVALHAGATTGWLLATRSTGKILPVDRREAGVLVLATVPPATAGLLLERPVARRLGTPITIAAGLAAGGLAMAVADRGNGLRRAGEAGARDGLWLGLAQSLALFPGVSRRGSALAATRSLGFTRRDGWVLSDWVGAPVTVGAAGLKLTRLMGRNRAPGEGTALAAGSAASFASTLLFARLLRPASRDWRLAPFAAYRGALALTILFSLRRPGRGSRALRRRIARP